MKYPDYEQRHVRWDDYKRFHVRHVNEHRGVQITQFTDTGEAIVYCTRTGDAALRGERPHLRVSNWATSDDGLWERWRLALPDGTECKQSWLNEGGHQLLWIDHDHEIALNGSIAKNNAPWPAYVRNKLAAIYYTGEKDRPQAAGELEVSMPTKRAAHEKRWLEMLIGAARAWVTMHPEVEKIDGTIVRFKEKGGPLYAKFLTHAYSKPVRMIGVNGGFLDPYKKGVDDSTLIGKTLDDLSDLTIMQLALHGTYTPRTTIKAPYLQATRR